MGFCNLSDTHRACIVMTMSSCFLIAELSVGFRTNSIALIADAFHCLNDVITFIVALTAIRLQNRKDHPPHLTFGYQRAAVLGAFFNSVFLMALGLSIFLESVQVFINLKREHLEKPKMVLIMGCIGLANNLAMALVYHGHNGHNGHTHAHSHKPKDHDPLTLPEKQPASLSADLELATPACLPVKRSLYARLRLLVLNPDLSKRAVILHLLGDGINDIGIIFASLLMIHLHSPARFYADPAISVLIALSICGSAVPLVKRTGTILLGCVPGDVQMGDVEAALRSVRGVEGVHGVQVWMVDQAECVVCAHVVVGKGTLGDGGRNELLTKLSEALGRVLAPERVHSITFQIEEAGGVAVGKEKADVLPLVREAGDTDELHAV